MVVATTGLFPTEFDETTDALCLTLDALGVPDEELHADQQFVYDLMMTVGDAADDIPFESTMEAMDLMFIGLIYHRHMPFEDEATGRMIVMGENNADYTVTLSMLTTALATQQGITYEQIMGTANEGAAFILGHMRQPQSDSDDDTALHRDVISLATLGLLVHRYMPRTNKRPKKKGTTHADE